MENLTSKIFGEEKKHTTSTTKHYSSHRPWTLSHPQRVHTTLKKKNIKNNLALLFSTEMFQRYKLTGRAFSHPSGSLRLRRALNSAASVGYFFS